MFYWGFEMEVYLIGDTIEEFVGSKLPSKREILSLVQHHRRTYPQEQFISTAKFVSIKLLEWWKKFHIPTVSQRKAVKLVTEIHSKWRTLQKSRSQSNAKTKESEKTFCDELDDLFDVGHEDVLALIKNAQIKECLIEQRKKGRPGHMVEIAEIPEITEENKKLKRAEAEKKRKAKYELEKSEQGNFLQKSIPPCRISIDRNRILTIFLVMVELADDDESCDSAESGIGFASVDENSSDPMYTPTDSEQRGTIDCINEDLVSALDRCGITDCKAVYVLYKAAASFGLNPDGMIISRSAIQRRRNSARKAIATKIKEDFTVSKNQVKGKSHQNQTK